MSNVEYPNLVPLIHQMAKRYAWCGAEYDDLVAEGYIGLQIAKERFDPDTGNKFITFAWWWIRGKVQQAADRHIRAQSGLVSIESQDSCGKSMHEKLAEVPDTSGPSMQDIMGPYVDRMLAVLSVKERVIIARRFDFDFEVEPKREAHLAEAREELAALLK